jgi:hydroxylamine dehydrogenase
MKLFRFQIFFTFFIVILFASVAFAQECIECHKKVTPNIVSDWELSKHSKQNISCSKCHGDQHKFMVDFQKAKIPPDRMGVLSGATSNAG